MGGMVEAIERGFPQKEIADSSYRFQQAMERREKVVVGVNDFIAEAEPTFSTLYLDESASDTAPDARGSRHDGTRTSR